MDENAISHYITDTFDGVDVVIAAGDSYFIYDPGQQLPPDRQHPFATIVTTDAHDSVSKLSRPAIFRLNVGVGKDTFHALFGSRSQVPGAETGVDRGYDFSALDQIMPHPVYGKMFWICVLNPSAPTFETLRPLLAEAYGRAVERTRKLFRTVFRDGS